MRERSAVVEPVIGLRQSLIQNQGHAKGVSSHEWVIKQNKKRQVLRTVEIR